ncbi:MAG: sulfotransferase, partial [Gammaproteobacteria bacterium]
MNPELAAALERYATDTAAREWLARRRYLETSAEERIEVAEGLQKLGHPRAAALWLCRALRSVPDNAPTAYRLGNALRMAGRERAAETILARLTREYPGWGEPAQSLAWLQRRAGNAEAAADTLEGWLAAAGSQRKAWLAVSAFLQDMGMAERAETLLAAAPDGSGLLAERGRLLAGLGRFDEAEILLRKSVAEEPQQAGAWLRLAHLRRWQSVGESPLALFENGLRSAHLDTSVSSAIGFALAKVRDDLGDYGAAWAALERANALRAESAHFDRAAWRDYEQAIYDVFTAEFCAALPVAEESAEAPVFIVGMPRSGTTLVERRLGRHAALVAAGELEAVEVLGLELARERGYPAGIATLTADDFAGVARTWRARLPITLARSAGEIVDKNPFNFLHLGLIVRLFPQARILHCRRDPLDTALSIWFQNFAHAKGDYAYRMADIAWMYGFYRRLMTHWERVLPRPVRALDYESLIAAPETELRALIEWLGLAWEPAILDDNADDGAITTASLWQARQPVYQHAVGRAHHYEPWIAPLRDALR